MSRKLKIVISDFHLGAGPPDLRANPLEDFIADEAFAQFLETLRAESDTDNKEVELIINGDFFEFLRVPAVDEFNPHRVYPSRAYTDSSQEASIKRLELITNGHPVVFDALSDFIQVEAPRRRTTLIKGNHDVNLYWPGVKQRLREVLGATGRRASMLLFAERYVSREGIYVEHGHQYAEKLSRWEDFDDPCDPANPDQLIYPVGSLFLVDLMNLVEPDRAWANSLKPLTALVWYCLEWDFSFAARMLLNLARYGPAIGISTGDQSPPSLEALCQQLSDEAACRSLSERYQSLAGFRRDFHMQAGRLLVPAASPPGMFLWPLPPDDESASRIAQTEIHEIEASMRRVATRLAETQGARVIVFGHTHRPHLELLNEHTAWVNCGTWQWLGGYDLTQADVWRELFDHPRPIPPRHRLTYARIDYDEQDQPHAQLNVFAGSQKELPRGSSRGLGYILDRLRRILDRVEAH